MGKKLFRHKVKGFQNESISRLIEIKIKIYNRSNNRGLIIFLL